MFHAVIHARQSSLHLVAETDPYNLETLRQHVVDAVRQSEPVRLHIDVHPEQRDELVGRIRKWVKRIEEAGAQVEVVASASHPQLGKL
jgi:hypothetical protein